jgi:hypothetical protein
MVTVAGVKSKLAIRTAAADETAAAPVPPWPQSHRIV